MIDIPKIKRLLTELGAELQALPSAEDLRDYYAAKELKQVQDEGGVENTILVLQRELAEMRYKYQCERASRRLGVEVPDAPPAEGSEE
jgi:hypothetical protein